MDDDVLKSVTSDTETEASKSELGEETMSVQDVPEPRPKEKVKPTANEEKLDQTVSPLDTPSQKESEPEASDVDPSTEEAPASDKVEKAKPQPKKSIEEKIEEKKQKDKAKKPEEPAENPFMAGMKLKKAKRVERKIEEPKMETVKLVKQQFEPLPTTESEEMSTKALVTKAEKPIKPVKEKPKKKKKAKAKSEVPEDEPEETETIEQETEAPPEREQTPEEPPKETQAEEAAPESEPETMDTEETKPTPEETKSPVVEEEVEIIPLRKASQDVVVEDVEYQKKPDEKEPVFVGMKLKKAKRVKRTWDEPELEKVELVGHKDEPEPVSEEVKIALTNSQVSTKRKNTSFTYPFL